MQLKDHIAYENKAFNIRNDDKDHHENNPESNNVSEVRKTSKLQTTMEITTDILKALKRAAVTDKAIPNYPSMDEVYPGVFIGNESTALDKDFLKESAITHILNVAQGKGSDSVDSNDLFYADVDISFLGIQLADSPRIRVYKYFRPAFIFIHNALAVGGKVLIHSKRGLSRAPTFACSYLILKNELTARESLLHLQKCRTVLPNRGFISQLLELDMRRFSFLEDLGNVNITSKSEFPENKNCELKISQYFSPHEKDITNDFKDSGRNEVGSNSEVNLMNGYIENAYIKDFSSSTNEKMNFKENIGNGSHNKGDFGDDEVIANFTNRHHELESPIQSKLDNMQTIPMPQIGSNGVTSLKPIVDEVYPGVYIGNKYSGLDKNFLKESGFTHILNAAQGEGIEFMNTDEHYYKDLGISFLGVKIPDSPYVRIFHIFTLTNSFIQSCLKLGGKILIHSIKGISRAPAIACSYIMVKEGLSVKDSLLHICKVRPVLPNRGFMSQLHELQWRNVPIFSNQNFQELDKRKYEDIVDNETGTKNHTNIKTPGSLNMALASSLKSEIKDTFEKGKVFENEPNSDNSGRKCRKESQVPSESQSDTTVAEILHTLKALALENSIKERVISTKPDIEEVYPNLYVGNQYAAFDKTLLKSLGITHILNAAYGKTSDFVNTSEEYYQDVGISFLGLKFPDSPYIRIFQYFKPTFDFINDAISYGGKVLVHSKRGISRGPTLACCYVMLAEQKACTNCLLSMSRIKALLPNRGFIAQLMELEWRRGVIFKDSIKSHYDKTRISTEGLTYMKKSNCVESKLINGLQPEDWNVKENVTYKTDILNVSQEEEVNVMNNSEIEQENWNHEEDISNKAIVSVDAMSSVIKATETMCALKDLSLADKVVENVMANNLSMICT